MTFFASIGALAVISQANGDGRLTLDQALAIAEHNAFAVRLAQSNLEKQHQLVDQNFASLFPKLSAGGVYTRFDKATSANFGGGQSIIVSPIDTKTANITLSYAVDLFGNTRRIMDASKAGYYSLNYTLQASLSDVRLAVKNAYYTLLQSQAQVKVAQDAVDADQLSLKNVQQQFAQGTSAKVDVLNAETQLAQDQSTLINANNTVVINEENLNNTLARPINTPLEVVPVDKLDPIDTDVDALEGVAESQRAEIKALEMTKKQLALVTRATEQGQLPSLNLSVVQTYNIDAQGFSARKQSITGTASINIPIYDHGQTRAEVRQARQNEVQAQIQYEQEKLTVSLEVRQALTSLLNAEALYHSGQTQVASATEALRLANLKYGQGEGILLEVLDARRSLTQAETNLVSAQYSYLQAVASLQRALGSESIPTSSKTTHP